jgi:hypothetical protein
MLAVCLSPVTVCRNVSARGLGVAAVMLALASAAVVPAGAHDVVDAPADVAAVQQPLPAGVVARVGAEPVTQEQYEHWRSIGAADSGVSLHDVRKRVALRWQVMGFLLLEVWTRLEAREHGIEMTDAEADRVFRRAKRESFESEREFRDYLEKSQMTEADARFQIRFIELESRLRRHAIRRARSIAGERRLSDRFDRRLRRKWRLRTACGERHRSRDCGYTVRTDPLPEPA